MSNTTEVMYMHLILQASTMHSRKHSKDKRCMFILHAIKLYKTDLGTSPLYYGLSRRVNGGRRWSLEYLVVTYAGFYFFEMLEHKEQTHQELYKVYFNGMFMIYLFIF